MEDLNKLKLKPRELNNACPPSTFKFKSTADLKPVNAIIKQDRAVKALSFGLDIENEGYNIYLSGAYGTGKNTLAQAMLEKKAARKKPPSDWCYVNNFKDSDTPNSLPLPRGQGRSFKNDVKEAMEDLMEQIPKALESQDHEAKKAGILSRLMEETNAMYLRVEEEAREIGFTISRNQNGVSSIPLKENGEPLTQEEFMEMDETQRNELMRRSTIVQDKINEGFRQYRELEKDVRDAIKDVEKDTVKSVLAPYFRALEKKYGRLVKIKLFLDEMQEDIVRHLELFIQKEGGQADPFQIIDRKVAFRRYEVNLMVDNSELKTAPVIFENNPSYANLFGQVEYEGKFGILTTDFTKIRAGSIHRANGGYLVLNVYDILKNIYIWDKLKKALKTREITVESLAKMMGLTNTEVLQAEAIPLDIKVVLIGEPIYYYLLYSHDEEFQKLFKVRADFDSEMDRNLRHTKEYAVFVASVCNEKNLRHFTPEAVARVVDFGSRMAENKHKLSTHFNKMVEVLYEANNQARQSGRELVGLEEVEQAIMEKAYRCALIEEKVQENIERNDLIINVSGSRVGEVNGLAVYDMGDYAFGKPVRITAKSFMGERGIINIEREIQLSGRIHSKGVLTLSGYLGSQYAQDKPLTLSASLTMEQSYGGVEGDSASSAELFALISSLSEVPVSQGIAATGSVNQNGEIQAVGGVNQKIEGFYKVCLNKGLTGEQGVIIPRQNANNLMLKTEVVEAVKKGVFHIWAIESIDQGLAILTGQNPGVRDENGNFPVESIHYRVEQKMLRWAERRRGGMRSGTPQTSQQILRRRGRRF